MLLPKLVGGPLKDRSPARPIVAARTGEVVLRGLDGLVVRGLADPGRARDLP